MINPNMVRVFNANYVGPNDGSMQQKLRLLRLGKPAMARSAQWTTFEFDTASDAERFKEFLEHYRKPGSAPDVLYELLVT